MKAFLVLLVLALAGGGAYYFYFKDHPVSWMQGPELVAGSPAGRPGAKSDGRKDFKELSAQLQGAMNRIPANLHDARQIPTVAIDIRSRLAPYVGMHAEYTTVTQVCDVIIDADQVFAERQEKCGLAPAANGASPQERARTVNNQNPGAYQPGQVIWDNQRLQADSKVRQLLATLENRRL